MLENILIVVLILVGLRLFFPLAVGVLVFLIGLSVFVCAKLDEWSLARKRKKDMDNDY